MRLASRCACDSGNGPWMSRWGGKAVVAAPWHRKAKVAIISSLGSASDFIVVSILLLIC